jgi:hypothetical protein
MAFSFCHCPTSVEYDFVLSIIDMQIAYDTLQQQIEGFTNLETLYLVLGDDDWHGCSMDNFIWPVPGREDPMWRAHLDYIDSMKMLKGRPTVKVEIGDRESFYDWLDLR